jgi:hypothetical protein
MHSRVEIYVKTSAAYVINTNDHIIIPFPYSTWKFVIQRFKDSLNTKPVSIIVNIKIYDRTILTLLHGQYTTIRDYIMHAPS